MPAESPTKWQAQAYRFGIRRLESAVSDGDALLRADRVRRRLNISIMISFIIAIIVLGAFTVYGFVNPAPKIGAAAVVIDTDTGGAYVSRGGRLYPAMNLASALLAAGRGQNGNGAVSTASVNSAAIATEPRGPLLGIPGAPNVLPDTAHLAKPSWTVCDTTTSDSSLPPNSPPKLQTTALLGTAPPAPGSNLGLDYAMFVTADKGKTTYLIWNGTRSLISLADSSVRQAFRLSANVTARPISTALLDLIPEGPHFTVPVINGVGTQPAWAKALGVHIGDVFALRRADGGNTLEVALQSGVQPIQPLLGDLIRAQYDQTKAIPLVPPKALSSTPQVKQINTELYPPRAPRIINYPVDPVSCVYRVANNPTAAVFALTAVPVPEGGKPVTVTRPGPSTVDAVYLKPGSGAVLATATPGQNSGNRPLYLVTDDGVAYPVANSGALGYLGLNVKPGLSTPELINLLPKGPTLDPETAVHFYPLSGATARGLPAPSSSSASPAS